MIGVKEEELTFMLITPESDAVEFLPMSVRHRDVEMNLEFSTLLSQRTE